MTSAQAKPVIGACERLESRMMLSVSTAARMSPQARLLAAAARPETQYLSASNREVRSVCADLLRQVASATKANEAEINLSKKLGDVASIAANQQDKIELGEVGGEIRFEQRQIQSEVNNIIRQIDRIVKDGQKAIKRDPSNADQRLQDGIDAIARARAEADEILDEALDLKSQAESRIAEIRSRSGAEGTLGIFSGNPNAVYMAFDGVAGTTTGDLTIFFRLDGDRLIGQQPPKARDRWSVATRDQDGNYLKQSPGTILSASIDCALDSNGRILNGSFTYDLQVKGLSKVGPQTYALVHGGLSNNGTVFYAQLLNQRYNIIVGELSLSR